MPNKKSVSENFIIVDCSAGDSCKGSITDFLCHKFGIKQVTRYSGGAQAAHHVVLPGGKTHRFSQFGAGSFAGASTYLSEKTLVDPFRVFREYRQLQGKYELTIDPDCVISTLFHALANQERENNYGTCGFGIGETRADEIDGLFITAQDIKDWNCCDKLEQIAKKHQKTANLSDEKVESIFISSCNDFKILRERFPIEEQDTEDSIFEGAQGILLDEKFGFHPYNTWTNTTSQNAEKLAKNSYRLGLIRSYMTRHGAGPFVTEDENVNFPELHNGNNKYQGAFRQGHLDLVAIKYAIECNGGIDGLAVSHMDCLQYENLICTEYTNIDKKYYNDGLIFQGETEELTNALFAAKPKYVTVKGSNFISFIEEYLGVKVKITSTGPTRNDKTYYE